MPPHYWDRPGGGLQLVSPDGPIQFERVAHPVLDEIRSYTWLDPDRDLPWERDRHDAVYSTSTSEWIAKMEWYSSAERFWPWAPARLGDAHGELNAEWAYPGMLALVTELGVQLSEVSYGDDDAWRLDDQIAEKMTRTYELLKAALKKAGSIFDDVSNPHIEPSAILLPAHGDSKDDVKENWARNSRTVILLLAAFRYLLYHASDLDKRTRALLAAFSTGERGELLALSAVDYSIEMMGTVMDLHARDNHPSRVYPGFAQDVLDAASTLKMPTYYVYPTNRPVLAGCENLRPLLLGAVRQYDAVPDAYAYAGRVRITKTACDALIATLINITGSTLRKPAEPEDGQELMRVTSVAIPNGWNILRAHTRVELVAKNELRLRVYSLDNPELEVPAMLRRAMSLGLQFGLSWSDQDISVLRGLFGVDDAPELPYYLEEEFRVSPLNPPSNRNGKQLTDDYYAAVTAILSRPRAIAFASMPMITAEIACHYARKLCGRDLRSEYLQGPSSDALVHGAMRRNPSGRWQEVARRSEIDALHGMINGASETLYLFPPPDLYMDPRTGAVDGFWQARNRAWLIDLFASVQAGVATPRSTALWQKVLRPPKSVRRNGRGEDEKFSDGHQEALSILRGAMEGTWDGKLAHELNLPLVA